VEEKKRTGRIVLNKYPENWREISTEVKERAQWTCIRCTCPDEGTMKNGRGLTVHHLDLKKANCKWWNLVALCQRCHLQIQHKVIMERPWMFEHSEWFKPYVAGYYAFVNGYRDDREFVEKYQQGLLNLGKPIIRNKCN
jgi:5-methylcytosine-specific restriction endonuclease McrA